MINQNDLLKELSQFSDLTWFFATQADRFLSKPIKDINDIDAAKLFELRAFNNDYEIKAIRGALNESFYLRDSRRIVSPGNSSDIKTRKQIHFLDKDTQKGTKKMSNFWIVSAIGGGEYGIPPETVSKIEIENYYQTDEKGFYKPFDFRVVRFL